MSIKSIKKEDIAAKFEIGTKCMRLRNIQSYSSFEQIAPNIEENLRQRNFFYMFSQSYYKTYILYGYQFEFCFRLSKSEKVQEAAPRALKVIQCLLV
jgi:hypothetical protein